MGRPSLQLVESLTVRSSSNPGAPYAAHAQSLLPSQLEWHAPHDAAHCPASVSAPSANMVSNLTAAGESFNSRPHSNGAAPDSSDWIAAFTTPRAGIKSAQVAGPPGWSGCDQ